MEKLSALLESGSQVKRILSNELQLKVQQPLQHGGHAFVFKVTTPLFPDAQHVLKLFRFSCDGSSKSRANLADAYEQFHNEVAVYATLANITPASIPSLRCTVTLTAEDEAVFVKSHIKNYNPRNIRLRNRWSAEEAPWKGVLLEYVRGPRLDAEMLRRDEGLQRELRNGLSRFHDTGVVWGDVKWRNAVVRDDELPDGKLVFLDFSNSWIKRENMSEEETERWEKLRGDEAEIVECMIEYGTLKRPRNLGKDVHELSVPDCVQDSDD